MAKFAKLSGAAIRAVVGLVVVAIVATGVYYVFFTGDSTKTVTARFTEAVGVYVGTPVKILGVKVGDVTEVKPMAQYVQVTMEYDSKYRIRKSDATAQEVSNSLVSDRYIQLGTLIGAKDQAAALASGATIKQDRTTAPAELDDIYAALNTLSVALGPNGANKGGKSKGALSELLRVSAANLKGNGAALGNSITKLAAAAKTLSDNKDGLFSTVKNLQTFTAALKQSDGQVRLFNSQLAEVSGDLASERTDLGGALKQLGLALNDVNGFVKNNQKKFHGDVKGLELITGILAKQKASLNEALAIAPYALANITHAYYPQYGAIGTRSNLASLSAGLSSTQLLPTLCGTLNNVVNLLGSSLGSLTNTVCAPSAKKAGSSKGSTPLTSAQTGGGPADLLIGSGK